MLEVELVSIRVSELAEPFSPFHLLWRVQKANAFGPEPIVFGLDVLGEKGDSGRARFYSALRQFTEMNSSQRSTWTELNPMTGSVGRTLNAGVRIRFRWTDVGNL